MDTGAPRARRCVKCSANYSLRYRNCPKCGKSARSGKSVFYAVFSIAFLAVAVFYGIAH